MTRGVLLVNLGTPASTEVADVRAYLNEFLMDGHVVDLPWPVRRLLVSAFILPFRPARSAAAYRKIWDHAGAGTGSPLLHYSSLCQRALEQRLGEPVALAMRYGTPTLASAVSALRQRGVSRLVVVPMYPHHADSTRTTTLEAVQAVWPEPAALTVLPPFYDRPEYLDALTDNIRSHLPAEWDHLLFSYHGLPERHITKADPTGEHCLRSADCCQVPSPAHATCYRYQVLRTSERVAERLAIGPQRYGVSFQSRLGRTPWLRPFTDEELALLPDRGVKRLVVACPAFVADNLETLEEMGISGRQTFMAAGGETFTLVPCLNADPAWIEALAAMCRAAPD